MAQSAQETLGQSPARGASPWLNIERWGLGGYGLLHNPVATLGTIGGAHLLATETVQCAMMGDTAAQQARQRLIEAHPRSGGGNSDGD